MKLKNKSLRDYLMKNLKLLAISLQLKIHLIYLLFMTNFMKAFQIYIYRLERIRIEIKTRMFLESLLLQMKDQIISHIIGIRVMKIKIKIIKISIQQITRPNLITLRNRIILKSLLMKDKALLIRLIIKD